VTLLQGFQWVIIGIVILAIINKFGIIDVKGLGPIVEWSLTIVLLNFFLFLNMFNNFYDTVSPPGKLVTQETITPELLPTHVAQKTEVLDQSYEENASTTHDEAEEAPLTHEPEHCTGVAKEQNAIE